MSNSQIQLSATLNELANLANNINTDFKVVSRLGCNLSATGNPDGTSPDSDNMVIDWNPYLAEFLLNGYTGSITPTGGSLAIRETSAFKLFNAIHKMATIASQRKFANYPIVSSGATGKGDLSTIAPSATTKENTVGVVVDYELQFLLPYFQHLNKVSQVSIADVNLSPFMVQCDSTYNFIEFFGVAWLRSVGSITSATIFYPITGSETAIAPLGASSGVAQGPLSALQKKLGVGAHVTDSYRNDLLTNLINQLNNIYPALQSASLMQN